MTRAQYFILYIALTTQVQIQTLGFGFDIGGLRLRNFGSGLSISWWNKKRDIVFVDLFIQTTPVHLLWSNIISKQRDEREITITEQLKHKQQHEWKMAFLVIQCMNIKSSKLVTINLPLGLNFCSLLTIIDQILEVDSFLKMLSWHLVTQADDFCSNLPMDCRFQHKYQRLQFKLGTRNYYLVRTEDDLPNIEFRKRYIDQK